MPKNKTKQKKPMKKKKRNSGGEAYKGQVLLHSIPLLKLYIIDDLQNFEILTDMAKSGQEYTELIALSFFKQ